MLKVKFYIREDSGIKKTPIYVRVTNGRAFDIRARTKENCLPIQWDSESNKMKEKILTEEKGKLVEKRDALTRALIFDAKQLNERLFELEKLIEKSYSESKGIAYTTEWLKNIIEPPLSEADKYPDDFVSYCDVFIEQKKHSISKSYIVKVKTIKGLVETFMKYSKRKTLKISEINLQFGADFENYALTVEGYRKNYVERNLKFIKTICYHAESNGIELSPQIRKIKGSTEKTEFQILDENELAIIQQQNFKDEDLDNVRDWLLISCNLGQRISDFMRFTTDMISKTKIKQRDVYFIEFTQVKTKKQIKMPVPPKVLEILNKRDWSFPKVYAEQKYNEFVKMVCQEAKITKSCYGGIDNGKRKVFGDYPKYKLITSHIGRRSFASNNYGRIPTSLLMVATGHSQERMFLKYIGKIDDQQSQQLASYFYEFE